MIQINAVYFLLSLRKVTLTNNCCCTTNNRFVFGSFELSNNADGTHICLGNNRYETPTCEKKRFAIPQERKGVILSCPRKKGDFVVLPAQSLAIIRTWLLKVSAVTTKNKYVHTSEVVVLLAKNKKPLPAGIGIITYLPTQNEHNYCQSRPRHFCRRLLLWSRLHAGMRSDL